MLRILVLNQVATKVTSKHHQATRQCQKYVNMCSSDTAPYVYLS